MFCKISAVVCRGPGGVVHSLLIGVIAPSITSVEYIVCGGTIQHRLRLKLHSTVCGGASTEVRTVQHPFVSPQQSLRGTFGVSSTNHHVEEYLNFV